MACVWGVTYKHDCGCYDCDEKRRLGRAPVDDRREERPKYRPSPGGCYECGGRGCRWCG